MKAPSQRTEGGFTLVELMMALVIFSVAVAGILSVAVSMTNGFREQRQALAAQDAVRAPVDMIADALRQVSPGVSDPNAVYDAANCTTGAITVLDGGTGPDTLDIIYGSGGIVTTITGPTTSFPLTPSGSPRTFTTSQTTNLAVGDYVLITNDFVKGYVLPVATGTSGTTLVLGSTSSCASGNYNYSITQNATVIRVQHARFTVSNDTSNNNMPTLWMDADGLGGTYADEPLAEGIEDMQIALGADVVQPSGSADGVTETASTTVGGDDWVGNVTGESIGTLAVRAVRLTLIARTTQEQQGNSSTYYRPAAENRPASATYDRYRRRVLKTVVEIRNAAGSP